MNLANQISLISAVLCAALAFAVIYKNRQNDVRRTFSYVAAGLALWNLFAYLGGIFPRTELLHRFTVMAAALIPPLAIRFLRIFLYAEMPTLRRSTRSMSTASTLVILLAAVIPVTTTATGAGTRMPYLDYGMLFYLGITVLYCFYILLRRERELPRQTTERTRLKYLRNGSMVILAAGLIDLAILLTSGERHRFSAMATSVYAYFIYLSILNYRLLEYQEIVVRAAIIATIATVFSAVYGVLVFWVDSFGVTVLYTMIASIIILVIYDPVNKYVEDRFATFFLRPKRELSEVLAVLSREMIRATDARQLASIIARHMKVLERVTDLAIYFRDRRTGRLGLHACFGRMATSLPPVLDRLELLFELESSRSPLSAEHLEQERRATPPGSRRDYLGVIHGEMERLNAAVVLPVPGADDLAGIVCIRDERAVEGYDADEITLLATIATQAAMLLENFRSNDRIRARSRMAALGEMAAGLAHEIRNPLGSIKGAVQVLETSRSPEQNQEFLSIILEEVQRLNRVVSEFLNYAREPKPQLEPVDLNRLIERTARQVSLAEEQGEVKIVLDLAENLPQLAADPEQIKQVLLNLVSNAFVAMKDRTARVLTLRTRWRPAPDGGQGSVVIQIADTGSGMNPETLDRVFTPFFTTRPEGTGIGLPVCERLVEAHGGTIDVNSREGEGTEFTIVLPLPPAEVPAAAGTTGNAA
ncbi:MAG: hypothetical protein KIT79_07540 [Deltaproteobacteria bacterium]|nr:hypothetical protein [Deltaproteobacteria bacterium]